MPTQEAYEEITPTQFAFPSTDHQTSSTSVPPGAELITSEMARRIYGERCLDYSANIFGLDFETIKTKSDNKDIQAKIDYLRALLAELYKLQHATIDINRYTLSIDNMKALQRIYPFLTDIINMELSEFTTGVSTNEIAHRNAEYTRFSLKALGALLNQSDLLNFEDTALNAGLQRMRSSLNLTRSQQQEYRMVKFEDISYNLLFGSLQDSCSNGVLFCTSPTNNMVAYHNRKSIHFLSLPNTYMFVEGYGATRKTYLSAESSRTRAQALHTKIVGIANIPELATQDLRDINLRRGITSYYQGSTISEYAPYNLMLNPVESLIMNKLLFSATSGCAYSHSHFSNNLSKFAGSYCRGSNTFDGTLRAGISTLSELSSWLCDMSLFVGTINVSDTYATLCTPPLIDTVDLYNSPGKGDDLRKRMQSLSLGNRGVSPSEARRGWVLGRTTKSFEYNKHSADTKFINEVVNKILKADLLLKRMTSRVLLRTCENSGASTGPVPTLAQLSNTPTLQNVDIDELYDNSYKTVEALLGTNDTLLDPNTPEITASLENTLPDDWNPKWGSVQTLTPDELHTFGDTEYLYDFAELNGWSTTLEAYQNSFSNSTSDYADTITSKLGLLFLAADMGRYVSTQIKNHSAHYPNEGTVVPIPAIGITYQSLFAYRQLLYTYLLVGLSIVDGPDVDAAGFYRVSATALCDTFLLTHHVLNSRYVGVSDPLVFNLENHEHEDLSNSNKFITDPYNSDMKDTIDLIVSLASKGDSYFKQLEFFRDTLHPTYNQSSDTPGSATF